MKTLDCVGLGVFFFLSYLASFCLYIICIGFCILFCDLITVFHFSDEILPTAHSHSDSIIAALLVENGWKVFSVSAFPIGCNWTTRQFSLIRLRAAGLRV